MARQQRSLPAKGPGARPAGQPSPGTAARRTGNKASLQNSTGPPRSPGGSKGRATGHKPRGT